MRKTDRVLIRDERLPDIMQSRQYAATRQGAFLASVPSDDKRQQHVVYLEHTGAEPVWLTTAPTAATTRATSSGTLCRLDLPRCGNGPSPRPWGTSSERRSPCG